MRRYISLLPGGEGRSVELVDELGGQRLDGRVELALYRIAQAAIDADGGRSVVTLRREGERVTLTIVSSQPLADGSTEAATIRDWAAALGADPELDTSSARGRVVVSLSV